MDYGMKLPNFIIPGTQKAATTSMYHILEQHPDIYLPPEKETWFFHWDHKYVRGVKWYQERYFAHVAQEQAIGEITPDYMFFPNVPARIANDLGKDLKFIFILRDPARRALSHYFMSQLRGVEQEPFSVAIALEPERLKAGFWPKVNFSYISRGLYSVQVEKFLRLFPRANCKFLIFEEDIAGGRIEDTILDVLEFLGVEPMKLDCQFRSKQAGVPRWPSLRKLVTTDNGTRKFLRYFLPPFLCKALEQLLLAVTKKKIAYDLPSSLHRKLWEDFFAADVRTLEVLIGRKLSVWSPKRGRPGSPARIFAQQVRKSPVGTLSLR